MVQPPQIVVQLVHIQGPLKGSIQELSDGEIKIGRHPDCQVRFAKEEVTLSRIHAIIVREGNRFKIVDQSTNGTFVNGVRVPEAYLKDGDVLMFAEGGPKVSFLTMTAAVAEQASQATPKGLPDAGGRGPEPAAAVAPSPPEPPPAPRPPQPSPPVPPHAHEAPVDPPAAPGPVVAPVKVPLAIQYGPTIKSFAQLPVVLGSGAACDFVIGHPALTDRHAQIFFHQDRYWIKDLSGTGALLVDDQAVAGESALGPNAVIALTSRGPWFRFLGGGRLVEIEGSPPGPDTDEGPPRQASDTPTTDRGPQEGGGGGGKGGSLFKKLFS
ncbi:FHA domain-containing protein [Desulfatitalea alkaliphila]|uniref:FHA domain-containing protein n=1 Tax=Desulfatitalea alkaliphila TaxID=2929485 RepID=A0AA41R6G9_9BACT|nr:FHA domain-containing protein [Desulfatitalea alkaliphila]MCJ8501806.1 FHA domain-containing protein [Desulfatitalea alkaliphila]